jgi:hypothetical protein
MIFPRIARIYADVIRLMKNCAASAAHGQGRVGRRVAPESTVVVLSARNDGRQSFSAAYSRSFVSIRGSHLSSASSVFSVLKKVRVVFCLKSEPTGNWFAISVLQMRGFRGE